MKCNNIFLLLSRQTSPAAEQLFSRARDRIFSVVSTTPSSSNAPSRKLIGVKECPPKWTLLADIIDEIRRGLKLEGSANREVAGSGFSYLPVNRVLVLVKDARTALHLSDVLVCGARHVADSRHRWFVSHQAAELRQKLSRGSLGSSSSLHSHSHSQRPSSHHHQSAVGAGVGATSEYGNLSVPRSFVSIDEINSRPLAPNPQITHSNEQQEKDMCAGLSPEVFARLNPDAKMLLLHVR